MYRGNGLERALLTPEKKCETGVGKMKFKITRTSILGNDRKPCKEAIKERYTRIEVRTFESFEEFDKKFGEIEGNWLSKGINHSVNQQGYIQREFPNDAVGWFVEINTLDELLKFQEKYGDVILTRDWNNPQVFKLEIYDDYRE